MTDETSLYYHVLCFISNCHFHAYVHQALAFRPFTCQMVHFSVTLVIANYPETDVYPNLPESTFNFFIVKVCFVSLLCLVLTCT